MRGFTLLEMMIVVVIIGLLATVTIVAVAGRSDDARRSATIAKMSQIKTALDTYYMQHSGRYPPTLETLTQGASPYLDRVPLDGWKREFVYMPTAREQGRPYSLYSMGKDGVPGTEEDISVWTMDQ